jgi:hypothetical protein
VISEVEIYHTLLATERTCAPQRIYLTIDWPKQHCCDLDDIILYLCNRISELTSMTPEDLVRRNLYDFCHVIDLETLRHAHCDGNRLLSVIYCLRKDGERRIPECL